MGTKFTLDNGASNGTSNLSRLLSTEQQEQIENLRSAQFIEAFGAGDTLCYQPSKGYTDPEWYWRSDSGCVWGIGWRRGWIRLRGRGSEQKTPGGLFWSHPSSEEAGEFVQFVLKSLNNNYVPTACN